jgi:RNA polymerase sigma-70 factor (ECF subfamily)
MRPQRTLSALDCAGDDATLVARVARHDQDAFEMLMRRYNGRLFRIARAILKDDAEAEDALQDAYLDAYRHIGDFRGGARFGTWLTRITINQALMRLRKQKRDRVVVPFADRHATESEPAEVDVADERTESPPRATLRAEIRAILERRIDELPVAFRTVFVMRDVEDMSVEQTAECLSIPAATVRTRLFRARGLLRAALARDMDRATLDVFTFAGERCDRIVAGVLARVRRVGPGPLSHGPARCGGRAEARHAYGRDRRYPLPARYPHGPSGRLRRVDQQGPVPAHRHFAGGRLRFARNRAWPVLEISTGERRRVCVRVHAPSNDEGDAARRVMPRIRRTAHAHAFYDIRTLLTPHVRTCGLLAVYGFRE